MSSEQNQSLSLHWLPALAFVHIPSPSLDAEAGRKVGGRGESSAHAHYCAWYLARTWLVKGTLGRQWALFFVLPPPFFNEWSIFYLFFTFFSLKNWSITYHVVTTLFLSSVQFSPLSCVQFFVTPWTAARQASLSITNSWSLLKLKSESVMSSNHLILCHPLLLLPSTLCLTCILFLNFFYWVKDSLNSILRNFQKHHTWFHIIL